MIILSLNLGYKSTPSTQQNTHCHINLTAGRIILKTARGLQHITHWVSRNISLKWNYHSIKWSFYHMIIPLNDNFITIWSFYGMIILSLHLVYKSTLSTQQNTHCHINFTAGRIILKTEQGDCSTSHIG